MSCPEPPSPDRRHDVVLRPSGWTWSAPAHVTLLQSARDAGLILPSSCRNGTCRTCICRMTAGRVRYVIEWPGLSAEEKAEGWTLPCVAWPESRLALDVPKAIDLRGA